MKEQFAPYELALKLKELGFNEPCMALYLYEKFTFCKKDVTEINGDIEVTWDMSYLDKKKGFDSFYETSCTAPLWQQAFDWFRIEHNLYIPIRKVVCDRGSPKEVTSWTVTGSPWDSVSTYEEAREACLIKLIELCQHQNAVSDQ